MLDEGELCVCQMTAVLELAPSTVSQHLSVLSAGVGCSPTARRASWSSTACGRTAPPPRCCRPLLALFAQGAVASDGPRGRRPPARDSDRDDLRRRARPGGDRRPQGGAHRDPWCPLPLRRQLGAQPDGRGDRPAARRRPPAGPERRLGTLEGQPARRPGAGRDRRRYLGSALEVGRRDRSRDRSTP